MSMWCAFVILLSTVHTFGAEESLPAEALDHLRCPFAHVWLKHGPEGAAKILGVEPHKISDGGNATQPRCTIAPWVIGGAHMHALSPGYSASCADAPGRGSPYAWPLRWKAQLESQSMLIGFNKVLRESRGVNWYRFDKNWKRGDMYSSKRNSTVLHRGPRMTFLKWSGEIGSSKITSCVWMNMSVIGNVRPDWFLDKRGGGSIDVQYLGKEHIYYMGEPRLVRKWRKNDMRDTYFTVSVDELVGFRGVHWPLVVNVPGEGILPFDTLQKFYNHEVLAEHDEAPFLLDEAYVAAGGSCKMVRGGGASLPPWNLPSELDKDKNSWRSVEWTGSRYAHEAPAGSMLMV